MGSNLARVRVTGPLEPYAAGFASALTRVGYTQQPTRPPMCSSVTRDPRPIERGGSWALERPAIAACASACSPAMGGRIHRASPT